MKRILHISQYYYPHVGGIESICEDIVNVLGSTEEYEQKVICFDKKRKNETKDNVDIIRCRPFIKIRSQNISIGYTHTIRKTIKKFKPDILLLHFPNPLAAMAVLESKYKGKIIIFHHLDIVKQKILKRFVDPFLTAIYKKSDKIIATSRNYVVFSPELLMYLNKIDVIPLSYRNKNIELREEEKYKIEEIKNKYKSPIAIFIGRHVGYKGIHFAIEAVKKIKDMTFLVAGTGPLTNMLVNQARHYDNIKFIGELTPETYRLYLNASDFFIFPSWRKNEAFGVSLVEALAAGKPAVTFNVKGSAINMINLDGVTGIECENSDIESLREGITTLKDNIDLRIKYGENGKNRTRELFSPERFKKNIIEYFEKI